MKLKFSSIALFLASTSLFAGTLNDSTSISISNRIMGVYLVEYTAKMPGDVKLSIYDKEHQLVFTERILSTSSFRRPYNFINLAEGEYTIELSDRNGREAEKVNYHLPVIINQVGVTRVLNEPNKYDLTITNPHTDEVTLIIYDKKSEILYRESIMVNGKYTRVYNLIKESGSATFEIISSSGSTQRLTF